MYSLIYGDRKKALAKERYWNNLDEKRDINRKKYYAIRDKTSYEKILLASAKRRAKEANLSFDLELSDIIIPDRCPVLGIPLIRPSIPKRRDNSNPSIDRRDNNLGYIRGNVFVISWRANRLKCDGNLDEFENIVKYMRGNQ